MHDHQFNVMQWITKQIQHHIIHHKPQEFVACKHSSKKKHLMHLFTQLFTTSAYIWTYVKTIYTFTKNRIINMQHNLTFHERTNKNTISSEKHLNQHKTGQLSQQPHIITKNHINFTKQSISIQEGNNSTRIS